MSGSNIATSPTNEAAAAAAAAAAHCKLFGKAVASEHAVALLRKYHERGIDIRACAWEGWKGDQTTI